MNKYAVVQEKLEDIRPEVLQRILMDDVGMAKADATRIARKSRGILTDRVTLKQAAAICGGLKRHGYSVRAVPADKLMPRRRSRPAHWLEITDYYLGLPLGYLGDVHRISWPCVFVISAGQISELKEVRVERSIDDDWLDPSATVEVKTTRSERTHVTDLIAVADSGESQQVRISWQGLNYERTLPSAVSAQPFERYLLVLDELVRRSTSALVSPETRELLRVRKQGYSSTLGSTAAEAEAREFADYNRWLLQLVMFAESTNASNQ